MKRNINTLRSRLLQQDIKLAKVRTMIYYLNRLIIKHFQRYNPNVEYKYRPNKPSYEEWKMKYYGLLPQLVLSGDLRDAVLRGKVGPNGKVSFSLPKYGLYQIQDGRDFLKPSKKDDIVLKRVFKQELQKIRNNR